MVITSGGTGGHMFPALALGERLGERGQPALFAVDRRGARYLPETAARRHVLAASPSGNPLRRLGALALLAAGLVDSLARFLVARPRAVAAFGGYASVPTGVAAGLLRIPLLLHEQNAVLGRAHRLLLRFAGVVALTFPSTAGATPSGERIRVVGNPVRAGFAPAPLPAFSDGLELLVVGGSQGAHALAEVVPAAVASLPSALRANLRVTQQCRPEDLEDVRAAYAELGVAATTETFFADMPERLARAHLVVARAGASSVAELSCVGRPSILVPYPFAADDHQSANARALEAAGASVVIDAAAFTSDRLAGELEALLGEPATLADMAGAAAGLARPNAARELADAVLELVR